MLHSQYQTICNDATNKSKEIQMNRLSSIILSMCLVTSSSLALAMDDMSMDKGAMSKDSMSKDAMNKDGMGKDSMDKKKPMQNKDAMHKDSMKKDAMEMKGTMGKDKGM
jgi:pentapeptide MXKDX repeat protein